jgi:cation diffusion facilitator CzcD-associated flavoprotein CzcO
MPRNWKPYSGRIRWVFRHFPALLRLHRRFQGLMMSVVLQGVTLGHKRMEQFEDRVHKFIAQTIPDPVMREAVTPTTPYGCKRGLVSDDFYPALTRDNVELVAEGLQSVRPGGITTVSGREIDADVIIYCTGYRVMDFDRIDVVGLGGKSLAAVMEKAPEALKGIAAPDFPNYFFSAGPNGLAINVSYFTNVERNARTIVGLLREKQAAGLQAIAARRDVTDDYNRQLGSQFELYSWGASSCDSYYRTESGHAPFLFPGGFKEYNELHEQCSLAEFEPV